MDNPVPPSSSSVEDLRAAESRPSPGAESASEETWGERIFRGPGGVRIGWRLLLYLVFGGTVVVLLLWLGKSVFPDPVHGTAALFEQLYGEIAFMLGAIAPAFLMARIEARPIDDYGLPRNPAFAKLFCLGAVWGLTAITLLLVALRAAHLLSFGPLALHGLRILKFGLFWAAFFVVVALFEEFLFRGYTLYTLSESTGFWSAAALFSCLFGAIHISNSGEGVVGVLSAAAIGLFFCLTLRRTGNLWFAVGFHAAWDWGETYLYAVPDSGTYEPGHLLNSSLQGPAWLSGGTVGPEGSILCFILIAALWVVFDRRYREAHYKMAGAPAPAPAPGGPLYHE